MQANYNYFFKSPWQDMQKICLQKSMNCKSNLPKFMREIYYMSPKIRGTEMYSHGFLEISGFNYIIVLWIFGDIWKLNISKNPWEYISVPRISWIPRIFGDIPFLYSLVISKYNYWPCRIVLYVCGAKLYFLIFSSNICTTFAKYI